jgi:hypothetical protein
MIFNIFLSAILVQNAATFFLSTPKTQKIQSSLRASIKNPLFFFPASILSIAYILLLLLNHWKKPISLLKKF